MTNLKYKLTTGLATAGLLGASFAPAAFAQTVEINGTGALSNNEVEVENEHEVEVTQTNNTTVVTSVFSASNTGGNLSSFNTRGNNTIRTGNSRNTVGVVVEGGSNDVVLPDPCDCEPADVLIRNTGALSNNEVEVENESETTVEQDSETTVVTEATLLSNTGKNRTSFNTRGNNRTRTGNSINELLVSVMASFNRVR